MTMPIKISIAAVLMTSISFGQTAEVQVDLPENPTTIPVTSRLRGFNYIKNYKRIQLLLEKGFNLMEMVRITGMGRSTIIQYRDLVYLYHSKLKPNLQEQSKAGSASKKPCVGVDECLSCQRRFESAFFVEN